MLLNETQPSDAIPSRRFGRTALVVLGITSVTAGAFAGVAYAIGVDTQTQDAVLGLMYAVGAVGLIWSIVLSIRALRNGESIVWPALVLLMLFWGASVPLLSTWNSATRGTSENYIIHFLCLPVVIPLFTLALTISFILYVWKSRVAIQATQSGTRAARAWLLVPGLLLLILTPFVFYAYGGSMKDYQGETIWPLSAARVLPRKIGDIVYRIWVSLPSEVQGDGPVTLIENRMTSEGFHRALVDAILPQTALSRSDERVLMLFYRTQPRDAVSIVIERIAQNDVASVYLTYAAGVTFARNANAKELADLCTNKAFQTLPYEFLAGLASEIGDSSKTSPEALAVARVWVSGSNLVLIRLGCRMLAVHGSTSDLLSALEVATIQKNEFSDMIILRVDVRRSEAWGAMLTHADVGIQQTVLRFLLNAYRFKSELAQNRDLPKALERGLASSEPQSRITTALMVFVVKDQLPADLQARFFHSNRLGPQRINAPAVLNASETEQAEVIERARAVLRNW